jgi:hypothetical protein
MAIVALRPAAPPPIMSTSCGPSASSLTPYLLVDQHAASMVLDQVVEAAVVELLPVGVATTGEQDVLGDEALLVLRHGALTAVLVTARR